MELIWILAILSVGSALGALTTYIHFAHKTIRNVECQLLELEGRVTEGMVLIPREEYTRLREVVGDELLREELISAMEEEMETCTDDLGKA
tara:strand:- start:4108 stop:4380 length:273 start_codon:yes stop_codon:yes gene_type:complete